MWIENSFVNFYIDNTKASVGSTILKQKVIWQKWPDYTQLQVESIDFSLWLKNSFKSEDEIILKMDIEGAEYDILNKMIKDETIKLIKKLFIEWRRKKVGISKSTHEKMVNKIKQYVFIEYWDGLNYM